MRARVSLAAQVLHPRCQDRKRLSGMGRPLFIWSHPIKNRNGAKVGGQADTRNATQYAITALLTERS
jgi:hypothetical protein